MKNRRIFASIFLAKKECWHYYNDKIMSNQEYGRARKLYIWIITVLITKKTKQMEVLLWVTNIQKKN